MGAVRAVTFNAAFARPASNRVMLKSERSYLLGVASHAHFLDNSHFPLGSLCRVDVVTITANHSPLWNRVVGVQTKLVDFFLVAASTNQ